MRLKAIHLKGFKRFTDTHIQGLPETARLIVLAGPNGSGKSSLFDGLKTWHWVNGAPGSGWDESYGAKVGSTPISWPEHVKVEFHEAVPESSEERKKLIYIRSAFRNEPDFNMNTIIQVASPLDSPRVNRMIDNDLSVSDNFLRLIMATISGVYGTDIPDSMPKGELRDRIIGRVREAMSEVFPDLLLDGVGGIVGSSTTSIGTFYFSKGAASGFLYKNLSAGEKAAFDLLLDAVIKAQYFDNTIWCIDEPETHLNTRVQATLLRTLVRLLPANSQMVLASHSLGFMSEAWDMSKQDSGSVAFLDLQDRNFDAAQIIEPTKPTRQFWSRTLDIALGDLARLVAPKSIVLCEGRPKDGELDQKAEFDASCYRIIFDEEYPDTDFLSIGNSYQVTNDTLGAGKAIQAVIAGTNTIRVVDRDLKDATEVETIQKTGIRVLSRRNIEAFLLDDDVLKALCDHFEQPEKAEELLKQRDKFVEESVARGNDRDDLKKISGLTFVAARRLLEISQPGSNWEAFAIGKLAPLIRPGMTCYEELREDIFGPR